MAREFRSVEEAVRTPGIVHVESGVKIIGYQAGDVKPNYCKSDAERGIVQKAELTLEQRVAALEAK